MICLVLGPLEPRLEEEPLAKLASASAIARPLHSLPPP